MPTTPTPFSNGIVVPLLYTKARTFASRMFGALANFFLRNVIVLSVGRLKSYDIRPSANMFFVRSASRFVTSISLSASIVIVVSGTSCTW